MSGTTQAPDSSVTLLRKMASVLYNDLRAGRIYSPQITPEFVQSQTEALIELAAAIEAITPEDMELLRLVTNKYPALTSVCSKVTVILGPTL